MNAANFTAAEKAEGRRLWTIGTREKRRVLQSAGVPTRTQLPFRMIKPETKSGFYAIGREVLRRKSSAKP